MSYSEFTLAEVVSKFSLTFRDGLDLFASVPETPPHALLTGYIQRHTPTMLAINNERARCEFAIAPILGEVQSLLAGRASLFCGVDWKVAPELGLVGVCDYLLCRSPVRSILQAPVAVIVEAEKDDIPSGFGQVIAGMVAAEIFNQQAGTPQPVIYGAVTTGTAWRFLKLEQNVVTLDLTEYHLEQLPKILGILISMVAPEPASASAA